ncbi:putative nudix domain-containing protein [Diaporthe ampelina]|uniref:Putative nudix domain-containing protein n=1 Tax=Diaporthe ampelina TaxID=1214573 RepID=A0A0G2FP48_9PEZI|nr:putative nudix domain-containing protein [Diaporthe ampelina]
MFKGLLSGLFNHAQPILTRSKSVFRSTSATYTNTQTNAPTKTKIKTKTSMADQVFLLQEYNNVPVKAQGLGRDQLVQWPPFKSRPSHPFHTNPYQLKDINIESYTLFTANNIGFLKLSANVSTADGKSRLPGAIFLRGPAVAMLVVLIPDDVQPADADALDEAYVLLTVQPRIPTGSLGFVELPAGMIDGDSNFAGLAAKEIEEELGLVIKQTELTCLTDKVGEIRSARNAANEAGSDSKPDAAGAENIPFAMYPSAGGCDEYIKIFSHERRVPRSTLHEWEGKYGGLRDEGEMITLKVVRLADLWLEGAMDSKALAAVALYNKVKQWEKEQAS